MSPWLQCANISQHEFKIAMGFLITMFYKCGKSILFNKFAETLQGVIIYNMSMIYIHITIITGICNNVIWICAEGMERGGGVSSKKESDSTKLKSNLVISNWWWCGRQIQDIQGLKNYRYKENDSWDFIAFSICILIILDINAKDSYNSVRILLTLSKVNWTLSDNTVIYRLF